MVCARWDSASCQPIPCGGTHVARLAELGDIVISQIKMKKGQLVVSYTLA